MNLKICALPFSCRYIWVIRLCCGRSPTFPKSRWNSSGFMSSKIYSSLSVLLSFTIKPNRELDLLHNLNLANLDRNTTAILKGKIEEMSPSASNRVTSKCLILVITFRIKDLMKSSSLFSEFKPSINSHGKIKTATARPKISRIQFK